MKTLNNIFKMVFALGLCSCVWFLASFSLANWQIFNLIYAIIIISLALIHLTLTNNIKK